MAGKQQIDPDKLRMDEGEFDRIMRKALEVKPEDGGAKKRPKPKAKKSRPR